MSRGRAPASFSAGLALMLTIWVARPVAAAAPSAARSEHAARANAVELLERLPLMFVPEQDSGGGKAAFSVQGDATTVWLSERGVTYRLYSRHGNRDESPARWLVALDLVGAAPRALVGGQPLPTRVSYFKGPKGSWRTGLPSYGSVVYREPWPGVDLVVSGAAGTLKSTFVVGPGIDPGVIRLTYRGVSAVRLDPEGGLVVETPLGDIREEPPVTYQEVDGRRVEVASGFELEEGGEPGRQGYHFRVGPYDPAHELVIDPVTLVYCGYIGGSGGEGAFGIALDALGSAYVVGRTDSIEGTFPVTVGPDLTFNGYSDIFVAKVSAFDGIFADGFVSGTTSAWSLTLP